MSRGVPLISGERAAKGRGMDEKKSTELVLVTTTQPELPPILVGRLTPAVEAQVGSFLTVTDFGGLDVGIPQAMRRSIDFAANSHGIGAG